MSETEAVRAYATSIAEAARKLFSAPSWGNFPNPPRSLICRTALRQPASTSASARVVSALDFASSGLAHLDALAHDAELLAPGDCR